MKAISIVEGIVSNPEQALDQHIATLLRDAGDSYQSILVCQFHLQQYWLDDEEQPQLYVFYEINALQPAEKIRILLTDHCSAVEEALERTELDLNSLAETVGSPVISLRDAMPLSSVDIPKPWGREIWYTGIEARGVSSVSDGVYQLKLPWLMAAAPRRILGSHNSLVLLKILDPLPDEVYGDLYFELHEKKQEVYVVTYIDKTAWPDGVGKIRFGFNKEKLAVYKSSREYLADYQLAVNNYRLVREQIDKSIDKKRLDAGIGINEPVSTSQLKGWESQLSLDVQERECRLRQAMDEFTSLKSLRVGDVVSVPLLTPHSLQHGVRTIEFQTPVYERKILSFGQKVLTQDGWDTAAALKLVQTDPSRAEPFAVVSNQEGLLIERIVNFDDFEVQRVRLSAGVIYSPSVQNAYCLVVVVVGELSVGEQRFACEEATLLPSCFDKQLKASNDQEVVFLLAIPK